MGGLEKSEGPQKTARFRRDSALLVSHFKTFEPIKAIPHSAGPSVVQRYRFYGSAEGESDFIKTAEAFAEN